MTDRIRWGVAATGHIADRFVTGLHQLDDAEVVAVGSRTAERAVAFGDRHGIPRRHGSYEDLAADDAVDVVYVASPHARHAADTRLFLAAGKPVLCEKPLALDRPQGEAMVADARAAGLFLMEAMWTRFLPAYSILRDLLGEQRVGDPRVVEASFGFRRPIDPVHRLFARELGGGSLLDLGIYTAQLIALVLGHPDHVVAQGDIGETGVDEQVAAVLHHPGGRLGVMQTAIRTGLSCSARISGTDGWIEVPPFMHAPDHLVVGAAGATERIDAPWEGEGLRFQAVEVHRCLRAGLTESPVMPLDETLALAGTLDAVREQIGLTYP
ncbi:MAG TPA: Gfo/Idh/MocA family oxidoreductase [Acidimicrobiales bacterium]|nr:Gfo/Idh/MocA family oxidoreductase [Acidimicrobiales bacterium]